MKSILVDTSALIALGNKNDFFHKQAVKVQSTLLKSNRRFLTTNAIVLEMFNAFCQARHKSIAIKLFNLINNAETWNCISIDDLMLQGIDKFKQMKDKNWSLIDCISIVAAEKQNIEEIFTTDHHFEQAGFKILLKLK